mmetsp:Transcript_117723/g.333093  ORF Transcript_117723/g.333093 Transcript_117723/m.333093 type:complete len:94 (+) Transcript_117723:1044-1325(+)
MCKPDTPDVEYVAQADGSCKAYQNHIFKKYRWWCLGFAGLLVFLVLVGCAGICNLCCTGADRVGSYKKFRTYSDSEEEETRTSYPARRQIGNY